MDITISRSTTGVLAALLVAVLGAAACTSHTSGKPTGSTTPATTSTSPAPSPTTSLTGSTPPPVASLTVSNPHVSPSSAAGGIQPCGNAAFDVAAADQQGATGHSSVVLRFHSKTGQACTIRGYPGVDAVTSSGSVLAHATRTLNGFAGGAHAIATLTVAPGATVSATLEWMNFDPVTTKSCATSASIDVTPANTSHTVRLPVHVTVCDLQIHPTVAGTTGNA